MNVLEETLDATLDANGELKLAQPPQVAPGPVRVTIRATTGARRGLADVVREIASEQRARGYLGRSTAELDAMDQAQMDEDKARDKDLDAARNTATTEGT